MTNRLSLILLVAFITVCGMSCSKKTSTTTPADMPSDIVMDFPVTGTVYLNGSMLTASGTITDNDFLASCKVEIKNKASGAIYYQQTNATPGVSFYRYTWTWTV